MKNSSIKLVSFQSKEEEQFYRDAYARYLKERGYVDDNEQPCLARAALDYERKRIKHFNKNMTRIHKRIWARVVQLLKKKP